MAMRPVKGKILQGFSSRHGDVKLSNASGSMWMNPVARITPAAKALIRKNMSCSGLRVGILLPNNGMLTPTEPAKRMVAIEANLYLSASLLFVLPALSASHVQSPDTVVGMRSIRRNMKVAGRERSSWQFCRFGFFVKWLDRVFFFYTERRKVLNSACFESTG
jgi:hypothetical protein